MLRQQDRKESVSSIVQRAIIVLTLGLTAFSAQPARPISGVRPQQVRSVGRRIQLEQKRRNARIQEEARRRRQEYERQRREWKLWEQRRKRGNSPVR